MSQQITISVERAIAMFLGHRAYGIVSDSDELYIALNAIPMEQRQFVIENNEWSVAFDTTAMPMLQAGLYRLWNKQDWETSNNKHIAAVAKANADHNERERMRTYRRDKVHSQMVEAQIAAGQSSVIAKTVVDMMLASCSDEQIGSFYNMLPADKQ
jgi:hypothetical protein